MTPLPGQLDLFPYPASPGFKDRDTSRESAERIAGRAETLRARVFRLFERDGLRSDRIGMTADECADALGESVLAIRPRVAELVKQGRLVDSGQRRKNASGMTAKAWKLTPTPGRE